MPERALRPYTSGSAIFRSPTSDSLKEAGVWPLGLGNGSSTIPEFDIGFDDLDTLMRHLPTNTNIFYALHTSRDGLCFKIDLMCHGLE